MQVVNSFAEATSKITSHAQLRIWNSTLQPTCGSGFLCQPIRCLRWLHSTDWCQSCNAWYLLSCDRPKLRILEAHHNVTLEALEHVLPIDTLYPSGGTSTQGPCYVRYCIQGSSFGFRTEGWKFGETAACIGDSESGDADIYIYSTLTK